MIDDPGLRRLIVHCKRARHDVYVGRPSPWGNPFSHQRGTLARFLVRDRDEAIAEYEEWLFTQPKLLAELPKLHGKILGCWCAPQRCHAEVLVRFSNLKAVEVEAIERLETEPTGGAAAWYRMQLAFGGRRQPFDIEFFREPPLAITPPPPEFGWLNEVLLLSGVDAMKIFNLLVDYDRGRLVELPRTFNA